MMREADLHLQIADYLRETLGDGAPYRGAAWTAIQPERRGPVEGARMRRRGVRAGWPDFQIVTANGRYLGLEVKAKGGALSAAQKLVHKAIRANGGAVVVVRSLDEVIDVLSEFGLTTNRG